MTPLSASSTRPIFVVGKHRSGTTWLANQLCRHTLAAGVQHQGHAGIIESLFFSHIDGRFGDLRHWANFAEMVEVLSASTYFRVAGIDKAWMYSLWPIDYAGFFRRAMDAFAQRSGARMWIEKSPGHTLCLDMIARTYPDAHFIGINRSRDSVLASALERRRDRAAAADHHIVPAAAQEAWSWYLYNHALLEFARGSSRILIVRYEDMLEDVQKTMTGVCAFVGLPFEDSVVSTEYEPNTSFAGRPRTQHIAARDRAAIAAASASFRLLPSAVVAYLRRRRQQSHGRAHLPDWFFSLAAQAAAPPARAG